MSHATCKIIYISEIRKANEKDLERSMEDDWFFFLHWFWAIVATSNVDLVLGYWIYKFGDITLGVRSP